MSTDLHVGQWVLPRTLRSKDPSETKRVTPNPYTTEVETTLLRQSGSIFTTLTRTLTGDLLRIQTDPHPHVEV